MHLLIVGGRRADRERAALASESAPETARPSVVVTIDSSTLPFIRPERVRLPAAHARVIRFVHLERAFPNTQRSGTRLILTQSNYILQKWLDVLSSSDRIVATGDRAALERTTPEAFQKRGPWRYFSVVDLDGTNPPGNARHPGPRGVRRSSLRSSRLDRLLARALASASPTERARMCRSAVIAAPDSAVAALSLASACRERQHLAAARAALDGAIRLAPDWEAVHYENGKFWLGCEDLVQACEAFERASKLMPSFSAAFSNLGATLGELDRPEAAVDAFKQALLGDPDNFTIFNNIGVVGRELGRLRDSEEALRRVIELEPGFVFGHYNLGHTLFLGGRFHESLDAYLEGQRRDPEKNRRQGCRLAMARFATGDVAGAERDLWNFANLALPDEREDLLLEAYEIGEALIQSNPSLANQKPFLERIGAAIKADDGDRQPL